MKKKKKKVELSTKANKYIQMTHKRIKKNKTTFKTKYTLSAYANDDLLVRVVLSSVLHGNFSLRSTNEFGFN